MKNIIKGFIKDRTVFIDDNYLSPRKSQKIYNHSPDGFNWGYGGSGPAQLALAIMLEFTDKKIALNLYQKFKWEIVAKLPQGDFKININVKEWINENK